MKIRTGFVSNSSSSSFVFDLSRKETKDFFDFISRYIDKRSSEITILYGKDAREEVSEWLSEDEDVKEISDENLVYLNLDNYIANIFNFPKCVRGDY